MTSANVTPNGFFNVFDHMTRRVGGIEIPDDWWSRPYEYAFALDHLRSAKRVADMGVGWMGRPLATELASRCNKVYGVDIDRRVLDLPEVANLEYVAANFADELLPIPAHSLDVVYCISVLEDLPTDAQERAFWEWRRLLDEGGRVVFTCDVVYDPSNPLGKYPGADLCGLLWALHSAGFRLDGEVDMSKDSATIYSERFNLCAFHGVAVQA